MNNFWKCYFSSYLERKVLRTSNPCLTSVLTVRFKSNDMSSVWFWYVDSTWALLEFLKTNLYFEHNHNWRIVLLQKWSIFLNHSKSGSFHHSVKHIWTKKLSDIYLKLSYRGFALKSSYAFGRPSSMKDVLNITVHICHI